MRASHRESNFPVTTTQRKAGKPRADLILGTIRQ